MRRWAIVLGISLSLAAHADDPLQLAASDWSEKTGSGFVTWSAPTGFETLNYAELPETVSIDQAQALAVTFLKRIGCASPQRKATAEPVVFTCDIQRSGTALQLLAVASERPKAGPLLTVHAAPANDSEAVARQALIAPRAASLTAGRTLSAPATDVRVATEPMASATGPLKPLGRVVFDLDYVGGVGGATYPRYEPVYLFAGGHACRCSEWAATDVTMDVLNAQPDTRRGRWISDGSVISIQYADGGKPEKVPATRGVPASVPPAPGMLGVYQSVGGGGNVAFGGGTMTASANTLAFFEDGTFSDKKNTYVTGTGGVGGSRRQVAGRYRVDGSVLELQYSDGREVRTSLYYSSKRKRDADYGQLGVVWIGGKGFKRIE